MRSLVFKTLSLSTILFVSTTALAVKKVLINPCSSLNETPHALNLELGDWSCDGHCKTEMILVCASESAEVISKAYNEGAETLGFDVSTEVEEYEDSSVKAGYLKALYKVGTELLFDDEISFSKKEFLALDDKSNVTIGTNQYVLLYLGTAKAALPNLKHALVDTGKSQDIGGYGLFAE